MHQIIQVQPGSGAQVRSTNKFILRGGSIYVVEFCAFCVVENRASIAMLVCLHGTRKFWVWKSKSRRYGHYTISPKKLVQQELFHARTDGRSIDSLRQRSATRR